MTIRTIHHFRGKPLTGEALRLAIKADQEADLGRLAYLEGDMADSKKHYTREKELRQLARDVM